MDAYCAGDASAFERLFAALAPRVHGFFMKSFRNEALADDLTQATFMKLHKARADYHRTEPLRPWLFCIAARVRIDEFRRVKRLGEDFNEEALARADEEHAADHPPTSEARLLADETATQVRDALSELPESQKVIVHLHRYEDMTFVEIARVLGTTEGAVKLRAFRAYERLRKQLAPLRSQESHT